MGIVKFSLNVAIGSGVRRVSIRGELSPVCSLSPHSFGSASRVGVDCLSRRHDARDRQPDSAEA
jgi:hypothetical protein